jgi:two-component system sensor histidine kinase MprB
MTLRNRISVAAAAGVLIVVAIVSVVVYLVYAASLRSRVDGILVDAAQQAEGIEKNVKQSAGGSGSVPDVSRPVTVGSVVVQLFPGPVTVGQSTPFGPLGEQDMEVADQSQPGYFADASEGGQQFRVYTAAIPGAAIPGADSPGLPAFPAGRNKAAGPVSSNGGLVRVSRAASADDGALRNAALLLAVLTAAAAGLTYGAARLTAGRILRPVAELTAAAEHVTQTGDLTGRLRVTGNRDEVGRLGLSFNTMLSALDESLFAQRQLVADASHELRTPLTSLTTNLDLLEDGAGLADPQAPALLRAAREQAAELGQLITDLLDLARYRESAPHRETVRLDLLTEEAVRRVRQRLPDAAIEDELRPCLVHVDPAGVDHAVSNLLDNAVKWTPPGGTVRVTAADGQVSVADHGPGIAEEDLPRIFERFYRAPAARGLPGAGLGLAIVGSVAQANDGTVAVQTGPHGSTFTLAFAPTEPAPGDPPF